jgi:hypothetical protein
MRTDDEATVNLRAAAWRTVTLLLLGALLIVVPSVVHAGPLGAEIRVYPAGLMPSIRAEFDLGTGGLLLGQIGYNATDRRDWGEHQDESGGGFGLGAGWLHPLSGRWIAGVRVDYWWLAIDWTDPGREGSSDVGVLQPTVNAGYRWPAGNWDLEATLAIGGEFNVRTDGEDVGEGWIVLAGFGALFNF